MPQLTLLWLLILCLGGAQLIKFFLTWKPRNKLRGRRPDPTIQYRRRF